VHPAAAAGSVRQLGPGNAHPGRNQLSGILDLQAGDLIEWQCDVVNRQNTVLRFTDQAYLGEMCVIDAEAVGASCTTLNPKG
jgi:hypothetical protein